MKRVKARKPRRRPTGRPKRKITMREREVYLTVRRSGQTEERAVELSGVPKRLWQVLREADPLFKAECELIHAPNVVKLDPNETREQWLHRMDLKIRARFEGSVDSEKGIAFVQISKMLKEEMKQTVLPGEVHQIKLVEIGNRGDGKIIRLDGADQEKSG